MTELAKRELTEDIRILNSPDAIRKRVEENANKAIGYIKDSLTERSHSTRELFIETHLDYEHQVVREARPAVKKEIKRWAKMQGYTAVFSWSSRSSGTITLHQRQPWWDGLRWFFTNKIIWKTMLWGIFIALLANILFIKSYSRKLDEAKQQCAHIESLSLPGFEQ